MMQLTPTVPQGLSVILEATQNIPPQTGWDQMTYIHFFYLVTEHAKASLYLQLCYTDNVH